MMLYAVSDWQNYWLVESNSHAEAVTKATGKLREKIEDPDDNEVTCCMALEYSGHNELRLERMICDIDRVLYLDECRDTYHFR
ncbi:hypothetical protein M3894_002949 [Vibrio metschnikovii]|nr:hypothetical protein [Vibrio metschnikovii]